MALGDTDRETFDRLIATNLSGPFFLTQALRPRLADGSGIVFVGIVSAMHGRARHAAYAATKGVLGFTTSLAVELAPRVRVNCVAPGATDTPMFAEAVTAYFGSMDEHEVGAGRGGRHGESSVGPGRRAGGASRRRRSAGARCQLQHRQRDDRRRRLQCSMTLEPSWSEAASGSSERLTDARVAISGGEAYASVAARRCGWKAVTMSKLVTGPRFTSDRTGSYATDTTELMAAIRLERGRARELRAQADEIDRLVDNLVRLLAVSDQSQRPPATRL